MAKLMRKVSGVQGTFGIWYHNLFSCWIGERPWLDNAPYVSCIPPGKYTCIPYSSDKYSHVFEITNVPDRTVILGHLANFVGDEDLGWKAEVDGCLAFGRRLAVMKPKPKDGIIYQPQVAVTSSKATITQFMKYLGVFTEFELEIIDEIEAIDNYKLPV